ncbi:uncharacterized protein TrAtP1_008334 [Trichoderma atroviride]|uniref:uncharacterized protein n=1 Tax=Hypocrea atroviridis TaxID=63577 RepID=UPI003320983D|nr:hypothetical protein TrAtP1_008334 [Trichoderma atroviride]
MPSKAPHNNAGKDGEDSMTVVVPPSKAPKQPAPATDAEGDVAMDVDNAEGKEEKVDPAVQAVADIKSNFALLDRAVALFDARFSLRALRSISLIRKHLSPDVIAQAIADTYPANSASDSIAKNLLAAVDRGDVTLGRAASAEMDVDSDVKTVKNGTSKKEPKEIIPEIDVFLGILVQVHLFDAKQYQQGAEFSKFLSDRIQTLNRRTLDCLAAKVYFYFSLFCEYIAPLPPVSRIAHCGYPAYSSCRPSNCRAAQGHRYSGFGHCPSITKLSPDVAHQASRPARLTYTVPRERCEQPSGTIPVLSGSDPIYPTAIHGGTRASHSRHP